MAAVSTVRHTRPRQPRSLGHCRVLLDRAGSSGSRLCSKAASSEWRIGQYQASYVPERVCPLRCKHLQLPWYNACGIGGVAAEPRNLARRKMLIVSQFCREMTKTKSRSPRHPIPKVPGRREGMRRCANLRVSPDVKILLTFLNSANDRSRKEVLSISLDQPLPRKNGRGSHEGRDDWFASAVAQGIAQACFMPEGRWGKTC